MRIDIGAKSDIGRRKAKNEDHFGVFPADMPEVTLIREGVMLCVADGLGGHLGGEIASKLAVSMIRDALKEAPSEEPQGEVERPPILKALHATISRANESIHKTNLDLVKQGRPMGTTLLVAVVVREKAYISNVGDSRGYHIRKGAIVAQTEDHSWVDEQVKMGRMTKEAAETDHRRNLLTRSIGTHPEVVVDSYIWPIERGDMLLLCTDGLINMVTDEEVLAEFRPEATAREIADRLVDRANEKGGKDNITVVVARICPSRMPAIRAWFRRYGRRMGRAALLLVYGVACLWLGYAIAWWRFVR